MNQSLVWMPDSASPYCLKCGSVFSHFNRKHHCRSCGMLCCKSCASQKIILPALNYHKPVRVCNPCFEKNQVSQVLKKKKRNLFKLLSRKRELTSLPEVNSNQTSYIQELEEKIQKLEKLLKEKDLSQDSSNTSTLTDSQYIQDEEIRNAPDSDSNSEEEEKSSSDEEQTLSGYIDTDRLEEGLKIPTKIKENSKSKKKPKNSEYSIRNWNEEFQKFRTWRSNSENSLESIQQLNNLTQSFTDTATIYASIIISEVCLPRELKTIKPIDIGGIAGGQKYLCQGILFKFALDSMVQEDAWMYGGKIGPSDDKAMKAASNELIGLCSHMATDQDDLNYPLMCIIDYKGFRLIAETILPISKETICYGSSDAGQTIHVDSIIEEKMKSAAQELNLRGHIVGKEKKVTIYGPGDIECHHGKDNKYYVLDFGRLMPPEDPKFLNEPDRRAAFYNLLRPELVKTNPVPLISDAFSAWNADPDEKTRNQYNEDVSKATKRLYEIEIPAFSLHLDTVFSPTIKWENIFTDKVSAKTLKCLVYYLDPSKFHRIGINIRHLGFIRLHSKCPNIKKILLCMSIARVVKFLLRQQMRVIMREAQVPSDKPFKKVVATILNCLLANSEKGKEFWANEIKNGLEKKFQKCLTDEEKNSTFELWKAADVRVVFFVVLKLSNIKLYSSVINSVLESGKEICEPFQILEEDIKHLAARVKNDYHTYLSSGMELYLTSIELTKKPINCGEAERTLDLAKGMFEHAHKSAPVCSYILFQCGSCTNLMGDLKTSLEEKAYLWTISTILFTLAEKNVKLNDPELLQLIQKNKQTCEEKLKRYCSNIQVPEFVL